MHIEASLSALKSENKQLTGFTILIFPIDCCVRINHKSDGFIQW